eukprot:13167854-Alexandrium_andersonii.AAC.1
MQIQALARRLRRLALKLAVLRHSQIPKCGKGPFGPWGMLYVFPCPVAFRSPHLAYGPLRGP